MTSPAERYAAARRRAAQAARFPALDGFTPDLGFDLDDFQREACQELERGSGVLVQALCPGITATEFLDVSETRADLKVRSLPMTTPRDVVEASLEGLDRGSRRGRPAARCERNSGVRVHAGPCWSGDLTAPLLEHYVRMSTALPPRASTPPSRAG